jgi:hypothetical protein
LREVLDSGVELKILLQPKYESKPYWRLDLQSVGEKGVRAWDKEILALDSISCRKGDWTTGHSACS